MKTIIRCRAPLRLGMAGGGTDVSPFCDIYGGCVLNVTIDRYVYATIKSGDSPDVVFESGDLGRREALAPQGAYPIEGGLLLHRAVYNYFMDKYNAGRPIPLLVHTLAEAPAGSGLGASSTLAVSLCLAFAEYFQAALDEYELAGLAWHLEREVCGFAGGRQDQYAAAFGGVNFMEFMTSGRVLVNPLRVKKNIINEFESSLLLVFTGVSRNSETIIKKQMRNARERDEAAIAAMQEIKQEAYAMKASLLTGDFQELAACFRRGWEGKKRMAKEISNARIEELYDTAMDSGAWCGKISGAGGGGFLMLMVPAGRRYAVMEALRDKDAQIFPAHFTRSGAEAWRSRDF